MGFGINFTQCLMTGWKINLTRPILQILNLRFSTLFANSFIASISTKGTEIHLQIWCLLTAKHFLIINHLFYIYIPGVASRCQKNWDVCCIPKSQKCWTRSAGDAGQETEASLVFKWNVALQGPENGTFQQW